MSFSGYLLVLLVLAVLVWWYNLRSKDIAEQAGKSTCKREGFQFLDDTVQIKKLWLARNSRGYLHFCRLYCFEYSMDGFQRNSGKITLCGAIVSKVELENYSIYDG